MYVKSLSIKDLRCFERARLDLICPGLPNLPTEVLPNVNLLLGQNGAGKTTLLRGLVLAVLGRVLQDSGFVPYYLVRQIAPGSEEARRRRAETRSGASLRGTGSLDEQEGMGDSGAHKYEVTFSSHVVDLGDTEVLGVSAIRWGTDLDDATVRYLSELRRDDGPGFFVLGYGATRRVEMVEHLDGGARKRRTLRYHRVAGLFEDYIALMPLGGWLPQLAAQKKRRFQEILRLFQQLLPKEMRFKGDFERTEAIFVHRGVSLPFDALSDGFRGFIGLVGDLLYHLQLVCPAGWKLTDMTGLVLVDDIDLQMHPAWQRLVVPTIARTFPKLQFVLTSHSPIVAGTLHRQNVLILHTDEEGRAIVSQSDHRLHGLNADQIAISPYFGLESTRAEDQVKKLKKMSSKVAKRGDPEAAVAFLNELAGKNPESE
jgi:hypothetical protein